MLDEAGRRANFVGRKSLYGKQTDFGVVKVVDHGYLHVGMMLLYAHSSPSKAPGDLPYTYLRT